MIMAIKDNDYLETGVSMVSMAGGNGDYYFQIWWKDEDGMNHSKGIRFAMSGGQIPSDVKVAIAKLHWAMDENNLNEFPK